MSRLSRLCPLPSSPSVDLLSQLYQGTSAILGDASRKSKIYEALNPRPLGPFSDGGEEKRRSARLRILFCSQS